MAARPERESSAEATWGSSLEAAPLAMVVDLVRTGRALTRPQLVVESGLSRKVITQRVDQACELGLLREGSLAPSDGGRQARTLQFNADAGRVFGVLIAASEFTVGVADLQGRVLSTSHENWAIDNGPDATMPRVLAHIQELAAHEGVERPWGFGVGMPGPVDFATGRIVSPPIMPGWDGFSARSWLRGHFDAPVWVDNDVNLMAVGEWTQGTGAPSDEMLFIKVGTGIGAAIVSRGRLLRGQRGGAGDIGHTHVAASDAPCRCGQTGCLEAVAGGWALLVEATCRAAESEAFTHALADHGELTLGDLGAATVERDPLALELITRSATLLGEVAANLVNFANPGQLVFGGGVLRTGTEFLDIISDLVRRRSTRLASEGLVIRTASLDHREGVTGGALLAAANLFAPAALVRWVGDGSPLGHAAALQRHPAAYA